MGQRFESQFSQVNFGPRKLSKMLITFRGIYTCIKLPPKAKKSVKWKINCEPHPYTVVGGGVVQPNLIWKMFLGLYCLDMIFFYTTRKGPSGPC